MHAGMMILIMILFVIFIIISLKLIQEKIDEGAISKVELLKYQDRLKESLEKKNQEYKKFKTNYIKAVEFEEVKMSPIDFSEKSIDLYFKTLGEYLNQAKKSIKIVERISGKDVLRLLTEKPTEQNKNRAYFIANKYTEYYNLIESCIRRNINYQRIFEVSIDENDVVDSEQRFQLILQKFGEIVNRKTVEHIKYTYNISSKNCFYISNSAAFPYSFIIVDDETVLSVYYKKIEGNYYINELYVNRIDSVKAQLKKRVLDFKNLLKSSRQITEQEIEDAMLRNVEVVNYEKKDFEKKLKIIRGDKNDNKAQNNG